MRYAAVVAVALVAPLHAGAQLVMPKTAPVATGEQFAIYPAANAGMAGLSMAVRDSLADPWRNPARAVRGSAGMLHALPSTHRLSDNGGSGRTIPIAMIERIGPWGGGLLVARQQVVAGLPMLPSSERSTVNEYFTAVLGRSLAHGAAVGARVATANLNGMDGMSALYGNAERLRQSGGLFDARLGYTRELPGDRSLELLLLHQRVGMTHDVTYREWIPTGQGPWTMVRRSEHNEDRTITWGLHAAHDRPVGDFGWRAGWIATANVHSHPKIPNYRFMNVPRDPGTSYAFNLGMGMARRVGPVTFGVEYVYEPIFSDTWADAAADTATAAGGSIPKGGKTVENYFEFNNSVLRFGVGRDARAGRDLETRVFGLQFGLTARTIRYRLEQTNNVQGTFRRQWEQWMEWTPSWQFTWAHPDFSVAYTGRVTGPGRFVEPFGGIPLNSPETSNPIIAAPSGQLTMNQMGVAVHRLGVSVPIR